MNIRPKNDSYCLAHAAIQLEILYLPGSEADRSWALYFGSWNTTVRSRGLRNEKLDPSQVK